MSVLDQALSLAAEGIPSFPCLGNKRPACPAGFKDAVAAPEAVRALFRRYTGELIGVPTGPASHFDALDLDMDAGADEWLAEFCTNLPETRIHDTRSGGYHWLFRHHPGLRNSASKIAPGVDVRAEGGYVIWWPATGLMLRNATKIAAWPDWLLEQLIQAPAVPVERAPAPAPRSRSSSRYVAAALERACSSVALAGEGQRNHTLNSAAYGLARFIASGDLSSIEMAESLAHAALGAGLDPKETAATIASALRARSAA